MDIKSQTSGNTTRTTLHLACSSCVWFWAERNAKQQRIDGKKQRSGRNGREHTGAPAREDQDSPSDAEEAEILCHVLQHTHKLPHARHSLLSGIRFKGQRGLRDGHEVNISDWLEVMIEGPERFDGREETQETMEERRLRRGQVGERTE